MKIGYLLNTYPGPSNTFIRDEIEALEDLGLDITRIAVRRFGGALVDPVDMREREQTNYLLDGNIPGLFVAAIKELVSNPVGLARSLPAWWSLTRKAPGRTTRHIAYLMQAAALRQKAKTLGITHIHAHFSTNAAAVAMLTKLLGGPSYSFTAHGPDEFVQAPRNSFEAKIANAKFVISISEYCRAKLTGLAGTAGDAGKIHIARCGLDLRKFEVAPQVAPDNMTLVCVGRLCPQKGQVHLPQAIATLRRRFPGIRLFLLGDGESRSEIEKEILLHDVGREVVLLGWATNDQVRRRIADSRALLLPSYAEGLPVVIMESLAIGRPVLSTVIAGIPELVDSTCGWLVTPGDSDALAAALTDVMSSDPAELARMGLKGRARVEQLHDRRLLARRLHQLMLQSLENTAQ